MENNLCRCAEHDSARLSLAAVSVASHQLRCWWPSAGGCLDARSRVATVSAATAGNPKTTAGNCCKRIFWGFCVFSSSGGGIVVVWNRRVSISTSHPTRKDVEAKHIMGSITGRSCARHSCVRCIDERLFVFIVFPISVAWLALLCQFLSSFLDKRVKSDFYDMECPRGPPFPVLLCALYSHVHHSSQTLQAVVVGLSPESSVHAALARSKCLGLRPITASCSCQQEPRAVIQV